MALNHSRKVEVALDMLLHVTRRPGWAKVSRVSYAQDLFR